MTNKPTLTKTFAWMFLTIGFLMAGNVLLDLNGVSDNYAKLFAIVGNIGSVTIGAGMFYLGWQQHQHLKQKISEEEKKIFRENYRKLKRVIGLVSFDGKVGDEANRLIWMAEDEANLELPIEIQQYVKSIRELVNKNYADQILLDTLPIGEERTAACGEHSKRMVQIIETKPEEIYSKFMTIS